MIDRTVAEVFRAITQARWGVESDGAVECPAGYFTVVKIPEPGDEMDAMQKAVCADDADHAAVLGSISAGWYFVIEEADGRIDYARCRDREEACLRFEIAQEAYIEWVTDSYII